MSDGPRTMRPNGAKTLLRTAVWGVWGLLLITGAVEAQTPTVPGAPTIATVTAGRNTSGLTLTVTWTAPSNDGGSAITAYDVRYIETAADETNDANWTEEDDAWTTGSLTYTIGGLTESTQYDVQVRAVNATGDGDWSSTETGTTSDHGDMASTATALTLDTPMTGMIEPGTDVDYFTFTLMQQTGLLIWTEGDLDTVGELQNSSGTVLDSNNDNPYAEDDPFSSAPSNFFLSRTLATGTYSIKVTSYGGATGSYVLHTRAIVDSSGTANAHTITLDSDGIAVERGLFHPASESDYFKLTLSATTEVIIHITGIIEYPRLILLQSNGATEITRNDGSSLWPGSTGTDTPALIRRSLNAGTYYIKIESRDSSSASGPYSMHVNTVTDSGDTTATPLRLGEARGGNIASTSDVDHFRFEVTETTDISVRAVGVSISTELLDADGDAVAADGLTAGTYYIKVTASDTGNYTILAFVPSYHRFVALCEGIATPATDPLYGCQWHLNNAGQRRGAVSDEDINVEAVWAAGTLGAGINVAVVDDGMDSDHDDLIDSVDETRNHDYTAKAGEPTTDIYNPDSNHGTAVAGTIAARDNSLGGRGVAPRATLYGYNSLRKPTDANMATALQRNAAETHVSNNSWGTSRSYTGVELIPAIWEMAIETGLTQGAGGTGIFYAFSAGNGGPDKYASLEGISNLYGVAAVCAVTDQGKHAPYSEQGSNLWVCAPSGSSSGLTRTLDDRHGITTTDNDDVYTGSFTGTSAATPIVSGVAALVRSANTSLTWRDVKLILAASARKNDADDTGWEDGALKYGAAADRYHFNHKYGFGVVDAKAAVDMAAGWTTLPTRVEQKGDSAANLNLDIEDCPSGTCSNNTPVSSSLTMGAAVEFIEFVDINVNLNHGRFRDLQVELVSPSGQVSAVSVPETRWKGASTRPPLMGSVRFGSAKHLGENPAGTWTLRLRDAAHNDTGTLNSWSLTVYGHRSTPGAPTLASLTPGYNSLAVAWTAPTNPGASAVTSYDVRYIETTADETVESNWTEVETGWTAGDALAYTLSGLETVGYDVQVRAVNTQGDGVWSSTLAETPLSDAPSFADGASTTRSVAETAAHVGAPVAATDPNDDTLTYTLSGTDAASFAIARSSGQLSVASGTTLDYETRTSYAVTVTATDPVTETDPTPDSDSIDVTVTVTDAPGTVTVSSARPLVGQALTATVTDPDAPVSGLTWRWERSEDGTTWEVLDEATTATYTPSADDNGHYLRATASYTDADGTAKEVTSVTERVGRPSTGGGGSRPRDDHGNSAGQATRVSFSRVTLRTVTTVGRINTRGDRDYFRLSLPWAGVFVVETNGSSDTQGSVWQAGAQLAAATHGGERQNFRLSVPVEAGEVVIAVAGEQGRTGGYRLRARLIVGYLENPAPTSFQSGIGVISGWVCEAEAVTIEIKQATGEVVELAAAYGTERADTAAICGDPDNGFGVLFNWNLLGDGTHAVVALVDGIELSRASVTVTTLGGEFIEGLHGSFLVTDFPRAGEQVHLVWQESQQNFVLAPPELGVALTPAPSSGGIEGVLENPWPASFQSGIGVISSWVCAAEAVVIEVDGQPIAAAAGTERADTLDRCGDIDTGFGLLVNWAEFGAGAHEVVALVDGAELSRATVTVTLVDAREPFVRGLTKRVELPGFPTPDETLTLEWQERQQNFVITGVD